MLALVGSGEYLPNMEAVDRGLLDRLGKSPKVICLPTAAGTEGPERVGYWSRLGVTHFTRLGVAVESVPVINRADAQNPALAEQVAEANFVYLSGGRPDYLFKTLTGTPVWAAIQGVLAAGRRPGRVQRRGHDPGRKDVRLPRLEARLWPGAGGRHHPPFRRNPPGHERVHAPDHRVGSDHFGRGRLHGLGHQRARPRRTSTVGSAGQWRRHRVESQEQSSTYPGPVARLEK